MKQTHKGLISWKNMNTFALSIYIIFIFLCPIYFSSEYIFVPNLFFLQSKTLLEMGNWSQLEFNLFCSFVWSMNAIKAIVKWKHFRGRISAKKKKLFLSSYFYPLWFFFQYKLCLLKSFHPLERFVWKPIEASKNSGGWKLCQHCATLSILTRVQILDGSARWKLAHVAPGSKYLVPCPCPCSWNFLCPRHHRYRLAQVVVS